jgi:hypothetical protein
MHDLVEFHDEDTGEVAYKAMPCACIME